MKVLVVEDDPGMREGLEALLVGMELEVKCAGSLTEAEGDLASFDPDVCLTDLVLPDGSGIDLLRLSRSQGSRREFVVLTGHGSIDSAVSAMKAGAFDYLTKPLRPTELEAVLVRLREDRVAVARAEAAWSELDASGRFGSIVGRSAATREMCAAIARFATSDAPVMILGESGSGKEAAAQTLQALSRRKERPFVAVNCGAVSATLVESELFGHERGAFTGADRKRVGFFEQAHGGTLFLDEVTEMPPELQVRFLRVLETRTFRRVGGNEELSADVRVLASSNRDLPEAIRSKQFREDLYYRLDVLELRVPPLRERRDDVAVLARHFVDLVAAAEKGGPRTFTPAALELLARHDWPGNVRELRNAVHRAYVLSESVVDDRLLSSVLGARPASVAVAERAPAEAPAPEGAAPASAVAAPEPGGAAPAPAPRSPEDPSVLEVHVGESLEVVEKRLLIQTLAAVKGNKRKAAEMLQVSLKTIYNKIRHYGLEP